MSERGRFFFCRLPAAASSTRFWRSALSRAAAATRCSFAKEDEVSVFFFVVVFAAVVPFSSSLSFPLLLSFVAFSAASAISSTALSNALAAPSASPLASRTSAHLQCAFGHAGSSAAARAAWPQASLTLPSRSSAAAAFALGRASRGFPSAAAA